MMHNTKEGRYCTVNLDMVLVLYKSRKQLHLEFTRKAAVLS